MKFIPWLIIVALILLLLWQRSCSGGKTPIVRTDTVWKKETVEKQVYVPQPYQIIKTLPGKTIPGKTIVNTEYKDVIREIILPTDTAAILADYNSHVIYKDSILLRYGKLYVDDTVHQNRIAGRGISGEFNYPEITHTIGRRVLYATWSVMGNKDDFINMAGLGLMYKTRKDFAVEASAWRGRNAPFNYSASLKFPLTNKKQKR